MPTTKAQLKSLALKYETASYWAGYYDAGLDIEDEGNGSNSYTHKAVEARRELFAAIDSLEGE